MSSTDSATEAGSKVVMEEWNDRPKDENNTPVQSEQDEGFNYITGWKVHVIMAAYVQGRFFVLSNSD